MSYKKVIMPVKGAIVLFALTLFSSRSSVYSAEDYSQWSTHAAVVINTSASGGGANITSTQTRFPLLVRLTNANAPGFGANGGTDIRFSKGSNYTAALPYQIDYLSPTNDTAAIWVNVDTVFGNNATQFIMLHYGMAGVSNMQNAGAVFDTGNGYRGVWHLGEAGNNNAGGYKDATLRGVNGTGFNMVAGTSDTAGLIGRAQAFNGSSQYITMGYNTTGIKGNVNRSIEGWVRGNSQTNGSDAFGIAPTDGTTNAWFLVGRCYCGPYYVLSMQNHDVTTGNSITDYTWHYLTATYNGTTAALYIDGVSIGTNNPGTLVTVDSFMVGMRGAGRVYFQGVVDEVRISSVVRSADWINLSYQTQNLNQTAVVVNVLPPAVPVLSSPTNNALNQALLLTLSWGTASRATSYSMELSTSFAFGTTVFGQAGLSTTSVIASGLANSTLYYWQVSATNVGGTSAWSSVWSFTTTAPPVPGVPALSSPTNGASNLPVTLSLNWGSVSSAISYGLLVSSVANFATTAASQTGMTGVSATISGLANGTPYYWEVNATNVGGTSSWSGAWSFTTVPFPAPVLNSPSNGSTNQPVSPSLVWSPVSGAASYSLQVSQNSAFSSTVFSQGGLTALSQTVGPLSYIMTYFWQVNAYDGTSQTTAWSSVWSFTTSLPLPGTPVLSSPTNGTIDLPASLTLTWGQANLATSYNFQISTSSTFATIFLSQSVSGASTSVSNLALGTTYYWEVAGADINGQGSWSLIWSFTTATTAALANSDLMGLKTDFVVKGDALFYSLASSGAVEITFSDLLGRTALAVNRTEPAGRYTIDIKKCNLAAGQYVVRFKAAGIEKRASVMIAR